MSPNSEIPRGEPPITPEVRFLARVLWDYHHLGQTLPDAVDLLLVAGSHDERVAECGATIAHTVPADSIVVSGGFGKVTRDVFAEPEAVRFARIMEALGVPASRIHLEPSASHMGENITLTRDLLKSLNKTPRTGLVVTKPYMERRALATAQKQWPEVAWSVCSPGIGFDDYPTEDVPERRMIELMVGDLQRVDVYGRTGIQVPQEIPPAVWDAYRELVQLGFDRQLIRT